MVAPGGRPGRGSGADRCGRRVVRGALPAVAALLVAVSLVACAADPAAPTDPVGSTSPTPPASAVPSVRTGGTLRVGVGPAPVLLDPRLVVDDTGELIARALFEGLVDLSPTGGVVPAGAESWRIEDGGRVYRFALRRTTFHDGRPVTASDHADALLAALDPDRPPYGREGLLAGLLGATVVDGSGEVRPGTPGQVLAAGGVEVAGTWGLILRLAEPDPRFLHALTDVALVAVPPGVDADPAAFAAQPTGSGPFRLLGPRDEASFLRLVAVPGHHRAPLVDEVLVQFYPDDPTAEQRWSDLVGGRLQIARIPAGRRDEAAERFGRAVTAAPGSTTGLHDAPLAAVYAYAFDPGVAPVDDVRLRQALSAAVDREALATAVGGGAEPARGLLPPSLLGPTRLATPCGHCVHDPELARERFMTWAEDRRPSGPDDDPDPVAPDPVPLTLVVPRRGDHVAIATVVAAQWEALLDVRVALRALDPDAFAAAVTDGRAPVFRPSLRSGLGGSAAASSLLDPALAPGSRRPWVGSSGIDGTAEALLGRLRSGSDPDAVAGLEATLTEAAVLVPLLWFRHDLVVVPGVRGFHLDPTGRWWPERVLLR